ncbi:MAG: stage V sporulation protein SpoVM [Clostridia bacterium]|nr:stage V sporulation protein SpoVM [Clostridia bacterium]
MKLYGEGFGMKVVTWKSPRFLRGLLKAIFGIRD